ncbi:MAG: glycoside hydrolase family 26 protein, partial [Prevotella sp.]|nr:glycoside hydrolase family 26 protein [Prevotella sp.]
MKKLKAFIVAATALLATGSIAADIPSAPVTANTEAAKKLYSYFLEQYGQKTLSSVMANVNWNNECADKVNALTGKYPAMNCYDFIHICFSPANWIDYTNIKPVQEWHNAGGIVQLMWHFNVPKSQGNTSEVTCTPSETTFKAANALTSGTWENKWFYEQMDKVAASILKLQEAGIAATWRPFHEAAGNYY